jgi:hypothetical protein
MPPLWIPGTHRLLVVEWNRRGFVSVDADTGAIQVVKPGHGWHVVVMGDGTFAYLNHASAPDRMLFVVDPEGRLLVRRPVPAEGAYNAAIYLG